MEKELFCCLMDRTSRSQSQKTKQTAWVGSSIKTVTTIRENFAAIEHTDTENYARIRLFMKDSLKTTYPTARQYKPDKILDS